MIYTSYIIKPINIAMTFDNMTHCFSQAHKKNVNKNTSVTEKRYKIFTESFLNLILVLIINYSAIWTSATLNVSITYLKCYNSM